MYVSRVCIYTPMRLFFHTHSGLRAAVCANLPAGSYFGLARRPLYRDVIVVDSVEWFQVMFREVLELLAVF